MSMVTQDLVCQTVVFPPAKNCCLLQGRLLWMQQLLVEILLQLCCFNCCMVWSDTSLIVTGLGVLAQQRCLLFLTVWSVSLESLLQISASLQRCSPLLLSSWHTTCTFCYQVVPFFCSALLFYFFFSLILHSIEPLLALFFAFFFCLSAVEASSSPLVDNGNAGGCSGTVLSHATITTGRIQYELRLLE